MNVFGLPRRLAAAVKRVVATRRYRLALDRGEPAGAFCYRFTDWATPDRPLVELRLREGGPNGADIDATREWCQRQTLTELRAVGIRSDGEEAWRIDPPDDDLARTTAPWFAAPGGLPDVVAAHLESCLLIAAAEGIDAVVLREGVAPELGTSIAGADAAHGADLRPLALFRSDAYAWDPATDTVNPTRSGRLVKFIDTHGVAETPQTPGLFNRQRRGPYLTQSDAGPTLRIDVRDASRLGRRTRPGSRKAVLVLVPYLALGGVEHVLFETMSALTGRYDIAFATLAPHTATLGDRRPDFRAISPRLYSLGDQVHPDAMYGILCALIDSLGAEVIFNANGTTLFYDFVGRLKNERPTLRVIDHLYDHRAGYIDRYQAPLLNAVDAVVAVNHRIADELTNRRGWQADRVPVIWPCGRSAARLPEPPRHRAIRQALRDELAIADNEVVVLTAARMHPQKRPLDLVALADRVRDLEQLRFLIVGGGELDDQVDAAIAAGAGRITRLPFRNDIPDLILAADLGCLVSDYEGLPVFMLECLQLGRPFLGTRVGELGRVLDDTGAGLVVEHPGDLDALEIAIRRLVDPTVRADHAARALDAAPRFSVEACAEAYGRVFEGRP
jgi:glycosyltransferase involved in cell wall biosynthesis